MEDHCVSQGASPLKSRSTEGDSDTNTPILIDLTQDTDSPVLHTGTRSKQSGVSDQANYTASVQPYASQQNKFQSGVLVQGVQEKGVSV